MFKKNGRIKDKKKWFRSLSKEKKSEFFDETISDDMFNLYMKTTDDNITKEELEQIASKITNLNLIYDTLLKVGYKKSTDTIPKDKPTNWFKTYVLPWLPQVISTIITNNCSGG